MKRKASAFQKNEEDISESRKKMKTGKILLKAGPQHQVGIKESVLLILVTKMTMLLAFRRIWFKIL